MPLNCALLIAPVTIFLLADPGIEALAHPKRRKGRKEKVVGRRSGHKPKRKKAKKGHS